VTDVKRFRKPEQAQFYVAKLRCKHANALVIISSPSPGVKAERWCPECGAYYGPAYTQKNGWKNRRQWHAPGGAAARAYVKLCEGVRASEKARKTEALKRFKAGL